MHVSLKFFVALAFLVLPARAEEAVSVEAEVARVLQLALEQGPFSTWDDLRMAMPRSVRWHLAPPDREGARLYRRSGWIERAGRQAGVAACGPRRGPELLSLRVQGGGEAEADSVLAALREAGLALDRIDRRWAGEDERYVIDHGNRGEVLQRDVACNSEQSRAARSCATTYTLTVRPPYRSAPATRDCAAP